jgi:hypothetical protein
VLLTVAVHRSIESDLPGALTGDTVLLRGVKSEDIECVIELVAPRANDSARKRTHCLGEGDSRNSTIFQVRFGHFRHPALSSDGEAEDKLPQLPCGGGLRLPTRAVIDLVLLSPRSGGAVRCSGELWPRPPRPLPG